MTRRSMYAKQDQREERGDCREVRGAAEDSQALVATQTPPPMATSNSPTLTVLR